MHQHDNKGIHITSDTGQGWHLLAVQLLYHYDQRHKKQQNTICQHQKCLWQPKTWDRIPNRKPWAKSSQNGKWHQNKALRIWNIHKFQYWQQNHRQLWNWENCRDMHSQCVWSPQSNFLKNSTGRRKTKWRHCQRGWRNRHDERHHRQAETRTNSRGTWKRRKTKGHHHLQSGRTRRNTFWREKKIWQTTSWKYS